MSTIIEDFYILKSNNMNEIDDLNDSISSKIKEITKNKIYNQIVEDFKIWNNENSLKEVFSEKYNNYKNINLFTLLDEKFKDDSFKFKDFYYAVFELAEKIDSQCELNTSTNIYFKTQHDKTFYKFWNTNSYNEINQLVENNEKLFTYDYWDQTNKPSNYSQKEWQERKEDYDILFKGSNFFEDVMNVKILKGADNLWYKDKVIYDSIFENKELLEKFNKKIFTY